MSCAAGMEEDSLDSEDVERAKAIWAKEDVDDIFDTVLEKLDHLKKVLKKKTATDKEYLQGLKLLEFLDCSPRASSQDSSVVQVVIGPGGLLLTDSAHHSPCYSRSSSPLLPSTGPPSCAAPPPLSPVPLEYRPHTCCRACLSHFPSMPPSLPPFWGQNPLQIPQLCGFRRLTTRQPDSSGEGWVSECEGEEPNTFDQLNDWDVVYIAPCGLNLRNQDDVMNFLLATESYDILQVDFFSFNLSVQLHPPPSMGSQRPELDLSRGVEPTLVELCPGEGGVRPPEFRYRKDRWPHGCFLSRGPALFDTCCDCADGCSDAQRCACVAMTRGGRHYTHHRLDESVPSGVYECGPWCGCDQARCQNRLVQRGIRVRLQVFQTEGRSWGVRCRDDLDRGTFVCIYAGLILQRAQSPTAPPSPKLARTDFPSDDEVEVVTEWLAPPVQEAQGNMLDSSSSGSSPHVPVIQRPTDSKITQERDKAVSVAGPPPQSPSAEASGDGSPAKERTVVKTTGAAVHGVNGNKTEKKSSKGLKRAMKADDVHVLDASKEGNVGRFINHSCNPNLFLQNVFTDSHDPAFPVIAFFTNSVVKAGTELTWKYSTDTQWKQEVPCLCDSGACQGHFAIEENLCNVCEAEGDAQ